MDLQARLSHLLHFFRLSLHQEYTDCNNPHSPALREQQDHCRELPAIYPKTRSLSSYPPVCVIKNLELRITHLYSCSKSKVLNFYEMNTIYTSKFKSPYDGIGHASLSTIISNLSTGARSASIAGTTSK